MRISYPTFVSLLLVAAACGDSHPAASPDAPTDAPPTESALAHALTTSLTGDRSAACVAVAVIGTTTEHAIACADPTQTRGLTATTAFEIGSISKTMTGFLVASLADQGKLAIDTPLANYLPTATTVPTFAGQPILLKHVATHTAGLPRMPPRLVVADPANPYANFTESELFLSLSDVQLQQAPGTSWAYSNFGFMLLSTVATRASGGTLEALLQQTLFQPLGMSHAYIRQVPTATVAAKGHTPGGREVPAWEFPDAMAGVGGVRASLDDMTRYADALLGRGHAGVVATLMRVTTPLLTPVDGPAMGLGWPVLAVGANTIIAHDGGTGGFSSFIAVDKTRKRAVVVLADTSISSFGFINELALHLLDPALADAPTPRLVATPPATLLPQLVGRYRIDALDLELALEARNGTLYVVLPGEPDTALGYDNHGDFFPSDVDALITPVRQADGSYNLRYTADGSFEAQRLP